MAVNSQALSSDRRHVVPDGLPRDPAVSDLEKPERAVADPSSVAVDLEGSADHPAMPGVLVADEVLAIQASNGNVPFVDCGRQELLVAVSGGVAELVYERASEIQARLH